MKSKIFFLILFFTTLVYKPLAWSQQDCVYLFQQAGGESLELSPEFQKVVGFFSHLVKNYFGEHTAKTVLFAKHFPVLGERSDDISDFRFRKEVSESSVVSLRHGIQAALSRPGVKENWRNIQKKLQEIENLNQQRVHKVEVTKKETGSIWHKPILVDHPLLQYKKEFRAHAIWAHTMLVNKNKDLLLFFRVPNGLRADPDFYFYFSNGKTFSIKEIQGFTILEEQNLLKNDLIIITFDSKRQIRFFNSKGVEIFDSRLSPKMESDKSLFGIDSVRAYEKNGKLNLFQILQSVLHYDSEKALMSEENVQHADLTHQNHIFGIDYEKSTAREVTEGKLEAIKLDGTFRRFIIGKTKSFILLKNKEDSGHHLVDMYSKKVMPLFGTEKYDTFASKYLGSFQNNKNEEIFYFGNYEAVENAYRLSAYNSLTEEFKIYLLSYYNNENPDLGHQASLQLSNGDHIIVFQEPSQLKVFHSGLNLVMSLAMSDKINSILGLHEKDGKIYLIGLSEHYVKMPTNIKVEYEPVVYEIYGPNI